MKPTDSIRGLYAITPECSDTGRLLALTEAALNGGAAVVQYRNKLLPAARRQEQALALVRLCRTHARPLIVNDDIALAQNIDAAGVHIGKDDALLSEARAALGPDKIIGVSCYNRLELARSACAQGADYVAFGSMFPSVTKPEACAASLELLTHARRELKCPIVAIGGITAENAGSVAQAGAHAIAVISDLFDAPSVDQRARAYVRLFA